MSFSILISVYYQEFPEYLDVALKSIVTQSLCPAEIVLVKDGKLTYELDMVIDKYDREYKNLFKIIPLKQNIGLGDALNEGLKHCNFDIIARMDTDDICAPDRFKIQMQFLKEHPEITAVGGYLEEFSESPGDLKRIKRVPLNFQQIKHYARKRNPLNHPTVMFRKKDIQSVGGYERMLYFEDYYLWLKLLSAGYKLANIDKVLLYFRIGNDMIGRRHGYNYAFHEFHFAQSAKKAKLFSNSDLIRFVGTRFPIRLISKSLLSTIYKIVRK